MTDGRVKTIHPKVHGAIVAVRANPEHENQARAQGIEFIDLVAVNLYPFEKTAAKPGAAFEEIIENIDIGGPAMIRSAAKKFAHVAGGVGGGGFFPVLAEMPADGGAPSGAAPSRPGRQGLF